MSDILTPEQIEALQRELAQSPDAGADDGYASTAPLTLEEADILGEVGNMCMGASATTMYSVLGRKVSITTPRVTVYENVVSMLEEYNIPFIVVEVAYIEGVIGRNLLLLKTPDAAMITDLMLGGDGNVDTDNVELSELHLSAISEIMNQMVASSATSMSQILGVPVNISPPTATMVDLAINDASIWEGDDEQVIKISFAMEIEGLLKSELMQVMPYSFGKELVDILLKSQEEEAAAPPTPPPVAETPPAPIPEPAPVVETPAPVQQAPVQLPVQQQPAAAPMQPQVDPAAMAGYPQQPPPGYGYPPPQAYYPPQQSVNVQPVQYQSFDAPDPFTGPNIPENLDMIIDLPLQVSVELGKTRRSIKEVLDFNVGSVVVLDKLAGELVEVVVNGKLIARGEVVVIDENYGVRITEILAPNKRL